MSGFEVADRVRVNATGATGSVVGTVLRADEPIAYDVLLDRQLSPRTLSLTFEADELEPYDGEGPRPTREGLPGVGDALLGLAGAIGELMPDNPVVQAKYAELKAAVESAMPAETIYDDQGNGWKKCGPGCDLEVVETGHAACSRAGGCTR